MFGAILILLGALPLGALPLGDGSGGLADPITYLGVKLLPRTDLVARGRVGESGRVGPVANLCGCLVEKVLIGKERRDRILLLSSDPASLPGKRTECVLFLKRLGEWR